MYAVCLSAALLIGKFAVFILTPMAVNIEKYREIYSEAHAGNVTLVAVSKVRTADDIMQLYDIGQRDFGENYVQELADKQMMLPDDIRWHFIGHLQSNKVKQISPFVHMIHGVDSLKLLSEINKQGLKSGRIINCLLQVHVAEEKSKFGLTEEGLFEIIAAVTKSPLDYSNILISGLMAMASFTEDIDQVRGEFKFVQYLFEKYKNIQSSNCDLQNFIDGDE